MSFPAAVHLRGPFERALRSARRECILCAVDCSALRWFGAFAPLHRLPERRRRQIAEVAGWLLSFEADALLVLQPPAAPTTYLTQVLECIHGASPLPIHRSPCASLSACALPLEIAHRCRTFLQDQCSGSTLLGRIQSINRMPTRGVAEAGCAARAQAWPQPATDPGALVRLAACAARTLVLGDWFELALLRHRVDDAAPAPCTEVLGCVTGYAL